MYLFTISSQVQNYATLPFSPRKYTYNNATIFAFTPEDLTQFINSAEWNLASTVSTDPPINFILYVPPKSQSPMRILYSTGHVLDTNGFLIPQWGGVVLHNIEDGSKVPLDLLTAPNIMDVFLEQFLALVGVKRMRIRHAKSLIVVLCNLAWI